MKSHLIRQSVKQLLLIMRRYSFLPVRHKSYKVPIIIIMFDNTMLHGGLLDRIKGIISAKLIADELHYSFGIYTSEASFNLFKFLKLRNAPVQIKKTQLMYNIWSSRPVIFYNTFNQDKAAILKLFEKRKQQYHFYCNVDIIKSFYPHWKEQELHDKWRLCFHQLFSFDDYFTAIYQQLFSGRDIVGIHLRFQSLLGDNGEGTYILPQNKQAGLKAVCINCINSIQQAHPSKQLLVVSDSTFFMHSLQQATTLANKNIIYVAGRIAHIDFVYEEDVLKKALLDFYLLSKCSLIYQILAKGMYNSQFCRYAAVLGGIPYKLETI